MKKISYPKPIFILAFDHRSSFLKNLLDVKEKQKITPAIKNQVADYKKIIYAGFKLAIKNGLPKKQAAILVDEEFGSEILKDAKKNNFNICLPVEKSGEKIFDFAYGKNFSAHIKKYQPTTVKVLIRYNPDDPKKDKDKQIKNLKIISDWCQKNNYPFMIEALIPATKQQLTIVKEDKKNYDQKLRPQLTRRMVAEIQAAHIEASLWKIEGFHNGQSYQKLIQQIKADGRSNVNAIILGRGEDKKGVEKWLAAGAKVKGIIGFAIGRTIFWQPLNDLKNGLIDQNQASKQIGQNYLDFYKYFLSKQK
ncbi:MAG: DUF2090 domain-containing protein [Candidatus Buchananbacteria bacterium]|nr:DUF2090 domain-containing protein [Candidatus Buchananbacteria bacterium]